MSERIGCGDNSCVFSVLREAGGMGTNGGCRCFKRLESWLDAEKRWNRDEVRAVERDTRRLAQALREARAEAESLRLALAGAETCIQAEQEHHEELRGAVAELLRETAEAQREACARATEETWPESPVRAARIRNTPLVTGNMP